MKSKSIKTHSTASSARHAAVALLVIALVSFASGTVARASVYGFESTGIVDDVQTFSTVRSPWNTVQVGDPWTLAWTTDSTKPDGNTSSVIGSYNSAIVSYTLTIGSATMSDLAFDNLHILNGGPQTMGGQPVDRYRSTVFAGEPESGNMFIQWTLLDTSNTTWTTDAMPSLLDLTDFNSTALHASFTDEWSMNGHFTSIQQTPEPSVLALLSLGGLTLLRWGRASRLAAPTSYFCSGRFDDWMEGGIMLRADKSAIVAFLVLLVAGPFAQAAPITSTGFVPLTSTQVDLTLAGQSIGLTRIGYAGPNGGSNTGTPDTQTVASPGILSAFSKVGFAGVSGGQNSINSVTYSDGIDPINGAGAQTYQTSGGNNGKGYEFTLAPDVVNPRYVYAYVGIFQAGGTLTASNGTPADTYTDSSVSIADNLFGLTGYYRLEIPAGASQTIVSWVQSADLGDFDNVSVFAATVAVVPEPGVGCAAALLALRCLCMRRRAA